MSKQDRLSALIARFELQAEIATDIDAANLFLLADTASGELSHIEFRPLRESGNHPDICPENLLIAATIDLDNDANPLARALPGRISLSVDQDAALKDLAQLIIGEAHNQRCGRQTTLRRLFEVLVVMLLRQVIQRHADKTGLIAGLADNRISKAIVAIHERPEFDWRVEDLADKAGLSRSQFMERFKNCVGQPPAQYLREWRLSLARQDLEKGGRVKTVAQRYGYGSQEALSRAFSQRYGCSPAKVRLKTG